MIHTFIGDLGHFSVILAFVSALVSAVAYFKASSTEDSKTWLGYARLNFLVHGLAVLLVVLSLFFIIYNHYYEYHYAWSHSSNNLPTHFMISCFWEGQEGSFLLWIFWHVGIGLILMRKARHWEAPVMGIFALVQAFLTSMILGVVFFDTFKIGSSPFILLREVMQEAPVFMSNPNFVPTDGNGLNPLLQNYWMVIHPPTLFLGFALSLVPFAFAIAAMQKGLYSDWIKPSRPWALVGAAVLGIGIMMGAYWAYETLNFGGYWNWDPVENAVYIPWLIQVGAIHLMFLSKKNHTALKFALLLNVFTFILILYSTFLTRSGVLGEASVHSFTDLGLSGQLLIYLLAFTGIGVFYLVKTWKKIPSENQEVSAYSREFWVFLGVVTLCLSAFQVLVPTSIPALKSFLQSIGISSNIAPPSDQVQFYTKFQLWFGVLIAVLSGTAQFFYWKKIDKTNWQSVFQMPLILTMVFAGVAIMVFKIQNWKYIILLTAASYSLISNFSVLWKLSKRRFDLSGGAVAHVGIALMLLGILASAGYDKIISMNTTGLIYNREFPEEMNKENLLLFRNQAQKMGEYTLLYKGKRMESEDLPTFIDQDLLETTKNPYRMILKEDFVHQGKTIKTKGDTIQVYNENTYYEIEYTKDNGDKFVLFPRIQENPDMGLAVSPDISRNWNTDLYTHITNAAATGEEVKWSEAEKYELHIGDTFVINDYIAILDDVRKGERMDDEDVNIFAMVRILEKHREMLLKPVFFIKGNMAGRLPDQNEGLGIKITLSSLNPETKTFSFEVQSTQRDWIILKAIEKPLINLLWLGTILMGLGFGIATYRQLKSV